MNPEDHSLTSEQVSSIMKMLALTQEHEFDCAECLQHVSEFAESQLSAKPPRELLARVEQHLALCPECREEYLALMKVLLESGE